MSLLKTLYNIGFLNLFKNLIYKLEKFLPFSKIRNISSELKKGDFFYNKNLPNNNYPLISKKFYFSWKAEDLNAIPNWHNSCISGEPYDSPLKEWFEIPLYKSSKDIKEVWEASRMDWLANFSFNAVNGDNLAIKNLNKTLNDWIENNPPYKGTNWTCAQEASFRILNLATSAIILDQFKEFNPQIEAFLLCHLKRILPAVNYSSSQQNNHITSEASAMFIGGSWLKNMNNLDGKKFYKAGKVLLEANVEKLISKEGCFSQYSLNYHRLFLDTCSLCEIWIKRNKLENLSNSFYLKIKKSIDWLESLIEPISGDGPNIGANDGAKLFSFGNGYRDYKNSLQLANTIYRKSKLYDDEESNLYLNIFNLKVPQETSKLTKKPFKDLGGFIVSNINNSKIIFRYPKFYFRPSQSDIFHLDLWFKDKNFLRDRGSFSYNTFLENKEFSSVQGHNTVQFGEKDQMPKLSRFLYLDWPKLKSKKISSRNDGSLILDFSFKNNLNHIHGRKIIFSENKLIVEDEINGFSGLAWLRWNLPFKVLKESGDTYQNQKKDFKVTFKGNPFSINILNKSESKFYLKKDPIFLIEVGFTKSKKITSIFEWK